MWPCARAATRGEPRSRRRPSSRRRSRARGRAPRGLDVTPPSRDESRSERLDRRARVARRCNSPARVSASARNERGRARLRAITRGSRLAPGLLTTATVGWVPIFAATTSRTIDLARWLEVAANNDTPHAESQPSRKKFLVFVAKVGRCNLERFGESRSVWVTSMEMWYTPAVSRSSVTNEAERNVPPASARGAQLTRASPRPAPHGKVPRGRERIHREGCLARRERRTRGALQAKSGAEENVPADVVASQPKAVGAGARVGIPKRASRAAPMTR